jgi:Zn ribbon nucleic-acid-binding protein
VCPACGDLDSIMLKNDDSEVKCISCNYFKMKDEEFGKKETKIVESIKIIND